MAVEKNRKKKIAEIDVSENKICVVKDGKIEYVNPPIGGFGEHLLSWQNGKVNLIKEVSTRKI